jgi:hypothetical protein
MRRTIILLNGTLAYGDICERVRRQLAHRFAWHCIVVNNGANFATIARCSVILLLIGPVWNADSAIPTCEPLLTLALEKRLAIVPLLIDGANMPSISQWPINLVSIAYRNGVSLTTKRAFSQDIERLIHGLHPYLPVYERVSYPLFTLVNLASIVIVIMGGFISFPFVSTPSQIVTHPIVTLMDVFYWAAAATWIIIWGFAVVQAIKLKQLPWIAILVLGIIVLPVTTLLFGLIGPRLPLRRERIFLFSMLGFFFGSVLLGYFNIITSRTLICYCGGCYTLFAMWNHFATARFLRRAHVTQADVVNTFQKLPRPVSHPTFFEEYMLLRFFLPDGQVMTIERPKTTNAETSVLVAYTPSDPETAIVYNPQHIRNAERNLLVIALLMLAVGILILLVL